MRHQDLHIPFSPDPKPLLHDRLWFIPQNKKPEGATFQQFSRPDFFGNSNPVHIEYCSGNGAWICQKALERPHINFIACERRLERARKIWARLHTLHLKNLIVAYAEGHLLTKFFIPSDAIDAIYIHFPDPWPKRRHARRRIVNADFVAEMARICKKTAPVTIVTDDSTYSEAILALMQPPYFQSSLAKPYFIAPPEDYGVSFFEELFRKQGKNIRFLEFAKLY
jgi:tRNA (guanine-N7-)-methyltransferase